MDLTNYIGHKVKNKKNEIGVITKIDKTHIWVAFDNNERMFQTDAFLRGFLEFTDPIEQKPINDMIAENKKIERIKQEKENQEENQRRQNIEIQIEKIKQDEKMGIKKGKGVNIAGLLNEKFNGKFLDLKHRYTYEDVEEKYGINIKGFGRGINPKDKEIILISNIDPESGTFLYHDYFIDENTFVYCGEGANGDQKLTAGNKAIVEAKNNGKKLYLIIKLSSQEYYDQGEVELIKHDLVDDKDENDEMRKEYKFILDIKHKWKD